MFQSHAPKRNLILLLLGLLLTTTLVYFFCFSRSTPQRDNYHTIAYVTVPASENWRWIGTDTEDLVTSDVDVSYITGIHFAFGMLEAYQFDPETPGRPLMEAGIASPEAYKDPHDGQYHYRATLKGWIEEMQTTVDGDKYLRALVDLKKQKPELNVSLSIGGWDSDGFCYMAKTKEGRDEFIASCIDLISTYALDGIDIDWEYPTNGGWGTIAHCGTCVDDAHLLLQEMRQALDQAFPTDHKLLSIASGSSQPWVDATTFEALDYMNVMCYDFDPGSGGPQADLSTSTLAMSNHLKMVGNTEVNRAKINLGIPFYNEGGPHLVPYYKGWSGHVDASPKLTAKKMNWVKRQGYGGAFYWAYSMDVFPQDVSDPHNPEIKVLQRTVYETLHSSSK
ncbi:MAG: glycosyl hydrolase family 18 protein [Cellulosilyticaceae bacterium]